MPEETQMREAILGARFTVPQSVVFRSFPTETVVLNLQTGKYHGLNPTAGRMLEALSESGLVRAAALALAGEYGAPVETIECDICALCQTLLERGLIERSSEASGAAEA